MQKSIQSLKSNLSRTLSDPARSDVTIETCLGNSLKELQDSLSSLPSLLASTHSLIKDTIQESQNTDSLPQKSSSESCVFNKRHSKPWLLERESSVESCSSDFSRRSSRCHSIISADQIEVGN